MRQDQYRQQFRQPHPDERDREEHGPVQDEEERRIIERLRSLHGDSGYVEMEIRYHEIN